MHSFPYKDTELFIKHGSITVRHRTDNLPFNTSHDAARCSSHDPSSDTSQLNADVHRLATSCCMSNHLICMLF